MAALVRDGRAVAARCAVTFLLGAPETAETDWQQLECRAQVTAAATVLNRRRRELEPVAAAQYLRRHLSVIRSERVYISQIANYVNLFE